MLRLLFSLVVLALPILAGCAHPPDASTLSVRTTGDARIYGVYSRNPAGIGRR